MTITTQSLGSWTEATSDAPDELSGALALPGSWPWFPAGAVLVRSDQVDNLAPPPAPPVLASITPNTGPTATNTAVTVTGSNFVPGDNVWFTIAGNDFVSVNTQVVDASTINCLTPDPLAPGAYDVSIRNDSGNNSNVLAGGFTFEAVE